MIVKTFIDAQTVLSILEGISNEHTFYVGMFSNGREQGYYVTNHTMNNITNNIAVAFAQHRSSDSIIVYHGDSSEFDVTTNLPHDTSSIWLYENAKMFGYNEHYKCAQWIKNTLCLNNNID